MTTKDIDKSLAPEMEGKLYQHVYILKVFENYWACADYYTVHKSEVFLVNNSTMQRTGDTLFTLKNDCHCIGDYQTNEDYPQQKQEYTHKQLLHRLRLD